MKFQVATHVNIVLIVDKNVARGNQVLQADLVSLGCRLLGAFRKGGAAYRQRRWRLIDVLVCILGSKSFMASSSNNLKMV